MIAVSLNVSVDIQKFNIIEIREARNINWLILDILDKESYNSILREFSSQISWNNANFIIIRVQTIQCGKVSPRHLPKVVENLANPSSFQLDIWDYKR